MAVLTDNLGVPQYYTSKNGNTTSVNQVGGPFGVAKINSFGGQTTITGPTGKPVGFNRKCGNATMHYDGNNRYLGMTTNLGNGISMTSSITGQPVGYQKKDGRGITLIGSGFNKIGGIY